MYTAYAGTTVCVTHYKRSDASEHVSQNLLDILKNYATGKDLIFLGIGTDRSCGDSLGPFIGTFLQELDLKGITIYGTLENPVHAMNLRDYLSLIEERHRNPFIIAADACLGYHEDIGNIRLKIGPLKPGSGVGKNLPPVGDVSLTCVVNAGGFMEHFVLQNTRLAHVIRMAQVMAKGVHDAVQSFNAYVEDYAMSINHLASQLMDRIQSVVCRNDQGEPVMNARRSCCNSYHIKFNGTYWRVVY